MQYASFAHIYRASYYVCHVMSSAPHVFCTVIAYIYQVNRQGKPSDIFCAVYSPRSFGPLFSSLQKMKVDYCDIIRVSVKG